MRWKTLKITLTDSERSYPPASPIQTAQRGSRDALTAIAGGGFAGGSRPWRTQQRTQDMTRNTERIDPSRKKEASSSKVFVVAKDPAMHFGDTKPAFPGHGAVLLEVDDLDFYEHLAELLAEEQPDLADSLVPMAAVELKPAALIRARKELARTRDIVSHLDCEELRPRTTVFRTIAITAHALSSHADDLREVLPQVIQRSEAHLNALRRHAAVVCECWKLLNAAGASSPGRGIVIPHPLTREFELIKMLLEQSMPALSECELHDSGTGALNSIIASLTSVDPDEREVLDEYLHNSIQSAEQFTARLTVQFGGDAAALTPQDRAALDSIRDGIAMQAQADAKSRRKSRRQAASNIALIEELLVVSARGGRDLKASARRKSRKATTGLAAPTNAESPSQESLSPKPLTIDVAKMMVFCNGKQVKLDGDRQRQFTLLRLLLNQPDIPVSHRLLCAPGSPWDYNKAQKLPPGQVKSLVRELKRNLKPLGDLPLIIKNQTIDGEFRPVLSWS